MSAEQKKDGESSCGPKLGSEMEINTGAEENEEPRETPEEEVKTEGPPLALCLDHIVERILYFVHDNATLSAAAATCKSWWREVKLERARRMSVQVTGVANIIRANQALDLYPGHRVTSLLVQDFSIADPLFRSFMTRIKRTVTELGILNKEPLITTGYFHQMVRDCPYLTHLNLCSPIWIYREGFDPALPIRDAAGVPIIFPRIQRLIFSSAFNPQLRDVLNCFPNIYSLVIVNLEVGNPAEFLGVRLPLLKELALKSSDQSDRSPLIRTFLNFGLKLEILSIGNITPDDAGPSLFREFVESQGPTLRMLELTRMESESSRDILSPFPLNLPNLRFLMVEKPFVKNINHILNSFPSLEMLHLAFVRGSAWDWIFPKKLSAHAGVQRLQLNWIQVDSLRRIIPSFPNLTHFRLGYLDDAQAHVIFRDLPHLMTIILENGPEEQNVEPRVVTDFGLTGISKYGFREMEELEVEAEAVRKHPYIGNLASLTVIRLSFCGLTRPTEHSIYFGVFDLPNLQTFVLTGIKLSLETIGRFWERGFANVEKASPIMSNVLNSEYTAVPDYVFKKKAIQFHGEEEQGSNPEPGNDEPEPSNSGTGDANEDEHRVKE